MKTAELRKKTVTQLKDELVELHREQFNLRMQPFMQGSEVKQSDTKRVRRTIARIKTLLSETILSERANEL